MSNAKVFWNAKERAEVICRSAILMMDHGYTAWGPTVLEAQKVLPRNRQRPEGSVLTGAKASLADDIRAEIMSVSQARMEEAQRKNEAKIAEAAAAAAAAEAEPTVMVMPKEFKKAESMMSLAIESFVAEFKTLLKAAMTNAVAETIEEANEEMQNALRNLPMGSLHIAAEVHKEVSAVQTGGNEIKAHHLKVAIVGGTEVGGDKQKIEDNMKDIYDFRYIDSKNQAERARNCDIVLIRSAFVNHSLTEAIAAVVPKERIYHVHRRSPNAVNEWLMDYYTQSASH